MQTPRQAFLDDLRFRGQLHQCTHEAELAAHLASPPAGTPGGRRAYAGFDPTADSLTIGNLVPIIALRRFQLAGHTPVVVMGGGTGLIGDPSGKTAERTLRTREEVDANVQAQSRIFRRILDFTGPTAAVMVNNIDWLGGLSYLDALRDVGKHFSVNMMIQKESVKERLHNRDQGISYTEFSYMILQAYDFYHLWKTMGVTLQLGGSDQFGNIVVGIDLIRRMGARDVMSQQPWLATPGAPSSRVVDMPQLDAVFGATWPLVTKSDGGKFGKTESGAIWLTARQNDADTSPCRTSPFAFYQFWLNTADADVVKFLKTFTFLSHEEITDLAARHAADPGKREAHAALARHMTELLHGPEELEKVELATKALFSKGGGADGGGDGPFVLPEDLLSSAPTTTHDKALLAGQGMPLVDLLALTSLAKSKTEARTNLSQNAISVNGRLAAADARVTEATLLPGGLIALRRGKKTWHITKWA
ncbi:MAG TPA: tyrosine--tRNA ligase [Phycisphaerales bacterium]|nr:tyrosine--tRNA ligase [Phycisphaerales bacterium]